MFPHGILIVPTGCGENAAAVHRGILMIDTRRQGQDEEEFVRLKGVTAKIRPILMARSYLRLLNRTGDED